MAGVVRVRYAEGQFLGFDDLAAEQAHRDDVARRHLLGAHPWGVVSGLALATGPDKAFTVGPGVAVDGYGRTLCVAEPVPVTGGTGPRDVWLSLVDEVPTVCVTPAAGSPDPHHPPGVPPGEPDPPPQAAVGPAPGPWPIFLGRVSADGQPEAPGPVRAGLVGEAVTAPSGRARLQLGAESATDRTRFAVATEQAGGPPRVRLAVDAAGDVTVSGPTRFDGEVTVEPLQQGGIEFAATATPAQAAPWSCYRTQVERDGRPVRQLRIEIGHPGDAGDPATQRFVIGVHGKVGGADRFLPCLSVDATGTVTVHRELRVAGLVSEGPIGIADPRFAAAAAGSFVGGAVGTVSQAEGFFAGREFFKATLKAEVTKVGGPVVGQTFSYRISVSNSGTAVASHGQVYVDIAIADVNKFRARLLEGATFALDKPTVVDGAFQVPFDALNKTLIVRVTAVGVGPFAAVVQAQGQLTDQVKPAP